MGRRPEQTFSKEVIQMPKQAHEEMFNIANYQRNANQNHNEISPHTYKNDCHQKFYTLEIPLWLSGNKSDQYPQRCGFNPWP